MGDLNERAPSVVLNYSKELLLHLPYNPAEAIRKRNSAGKEKGMWSYFFSQGWKKKKDILSTPPISKGTYDMAIIYSEHLIKILTTSRI